MMSLIFNDLKIAHETMLLRIVASIAIVLLLYKLHEAFLGPRSRFPGPVAARFTDLWRFVDVWKGEHQHTLRKLHTRHKSAVVRVGPNLLSLSDPRWIKVVYSMKGDFVKTEAYSVNDIKLPDGTVAPTTFSVRDEKVHTEMMKPIQKLYNLNNGGYQTRYNLYSMLKFLVQHYHRDAE